jgi:hypothetical protein
MRAFDRQVGGYAIFGPASRTITANHTEYRDYFAILFPNAGMEIDVSEGYDTTRFAEITCLETQQQFWDQTQSLSEAVGFKHEVFEAEFKQLLDAYSKDLTRSRNVPVGGRTCLRITASVFGFSKGKIRFRGELNKDSPVHIVVQLAEAGKYRDAKEVFDEFASVLDRILGPCQDCGQEQPYSASTTHLLGRSVLTGFFPAGAPFLFFEDKFQQRHPVATRTWAGLLFAAQMGLAITAFVYDQKSIASQDNDILDTKYNTFWAGVTIGGLSSLSYFAYAKWVGSE